MGSIVLAWLLVLAAACNFEVRCDRLKVFYAPSTWRRARTSGGFR